MILTDVQISRITAAAWFNFIVEPRTIDVNGVGLSGYYGNNVNMTGEGTADLDKVLVCLTRWPRAVLWLDVGEHALSNFIIVTAEDVLALRASYLAAYGGIVKPDIWNESFGGLANAFGSPYNASAVGKQWRPP